MKVRAYAYKRGQKVKLDAFVLRVTSYDHEGKPATFAIVWDDEVIDLREPGSRDFVTGFIDPDALGPRTEEMRKPLGEDPT